MSNLPEFLLARIEIDERNGRGDLIAWQNGTRVREALPRSWRPRFLADCAAKREIIAEHSASPADGDYCSAHDGRYLMDECPTLLALARPYIADLMAEEKARWSGLLDRLAQV